MKKLIGLFLACALLFTSCTSTAVYYHDVKPADGTTTILSYESVDKIEYTDWTKTALYTSLIATGVTLFIALITVPSVSSEDGYYNGGYSLRF